MSLQKIKEGIEQANWELVVEGYNGLGLGLVEVPKNLEVKEEINLELVKEELFKEFLNRLPKKPTTNYKGEVLLKEGEALILVDPPKPKIESGNRFNPKQYANDPLVRKAKEHDKLDKNHNIVNRTEVIERPDDKMFKAACTICNNQFITTTAEVNMVKQAGVALVCGKCLKGPG